MTRKMWAVLAAFAALALFSVPTWSSSEEQTAPARKHGPCAMKGDCCPKAAQQEGAAVTECSKECCKECTEECAQECRKKCQGEMKDCCAKGGAAKRCCKQS